eukprot:g32132.t1
MTYKVQVDATLLNKHVDHIKAANSQMGREQNVPISSKQSERLLEPVGYPSQSSVDETLESENDMVDVTTSMPLPPEEKNEILQDLDRQAIVVAVETLATLRDNSKTQTSNEAISKDNMLKLLDLCLTTHFVLKGQQKLENILQGLPQVTIYLDDVLTTGKTNKEHLENLDMVLRCFSQEGVHLRRAPCLDQVNSPNQGTHFFQIHLGDLITIATTTPHADISIF